MTHPLMTSIDENGVATVTLNRPNVHNAFNDDLIWELNDTITKLGANPVVRAIVITGSGKSFCAGGDLNWMKEAASYSNEQNLRDAQNLSDMFNTLNSCPKPTIAIVNGNAFGGGVGLIACCDIAVGVYGSLFALSEVRLGLTPATISPFVISAIGERAARRYFLTAERFTTEGAMHIGLLHDVAPSLQDACTLAHAMIKRSLPVLPAHKPRPKTLSPRSAARKLRSNYEQRPPNALLPSATVPKAKKALGHSLKNANRAGFPHQARQRPEAANNERHD
ncbi:MAG: enoyl-CoA hydratase/isomerase family protein [Kordiimonadaceae bacterium]|nr:enoyl-CoA hydratase/isomerase family protein [Kordiimonadaceae bacterium]